MLYIYLTVLMILVSEALLVLIDGFRLTPSVLLLVTLADAAAELTFFQKPFISASNFNF